MKLNNNCVASTKLKAIENLGFCTTLTNEWGYIINVL